MTSSTQSDLESDEGLDPQISQLVDREISERRSDPEIIADLQDKVIHGEMAYRHLEGAIASSRRIGAAIGIVMAASKITEEEAFGLLTKISQRQNRKLRVVADDIVLTGTF